MSATSAQQLHEAILHLELDRVKSLLDNGADPNTSPALPYVDVTKADENAEAQVTPLHIAVFASYFMGDKNGRSTRVIRALLDAGAQTETTAYNIRCYWDDPIPGVVTPLDLALLLWKKVRNEALLVRDEAVDVRNEVDRSLKAAENVIDIIREASFSYRSKNPQPEVPWSVVATWKKLLLSEQLSDVHFICSDGIVLPAHRCILAAASPYFSTYFEGPWGELQDHRNGQWSTTNSSEIMSAILSFIYTGQLDRSVMQSDALTMLSAASEYNLTGLMEHCAIFCTRLLNENNIHSFLEAACLYDLKILQEKCARSLGGYLNKDNIKEVLQVAHHHDCDKIKMGCFNFIRQNATLVLTDRDMVALATEEPELWDQMTREISPAKRQRQDSKCCIDVVSSD